MKIKMKDLFEIFSMILNLLTIQGNRTVGVANFLDSWFSRAKGFSF